TVMSFGLNFVAYLYLLCGLCALALRAQPIALVDRGQAQALLVAGDREAADELARYVRLATGAALPARGSAPVRVLVGRSVCPADAAARLRGLGRDGYLIDARPGRIVLAGNGRDGTAFAVYDFLE